MRKMRDWQKRADFRIKLAISKIGTFFAYLSLFAWCGQQHTK